jgi:hypothetical protein
MGRTTLVSQECSTEQSTGIAQTVLADKACGMPVMIERCTVCSAIL